MGLHVGTEVGGATHDGGHARMLLAQFTLAIESVTPVGIFPGRDHARLGSQFSHDTHPAPALFWF
jgi:hypothetical protein